MTTSRAPGPVTPDEWAAHLSTAVPCAQTAVLLEGLDVEELSRAGMIDALGAWERHRAWLDGRQVRLLAALDTKIDEELPEGWTEQVQAEWNAAVEEVGCALKLAGSTAADRLGVARALEARHPTTLGLLEAGDISYQQAKAVTEACEVLSPEVAAQVEEAVAPKLPTLAAGATRRLLAKTVVHADPDGAAERHERRKREREMVHHPRHDGMALFGAIVPAEQAARMDAAVDAHAATFTDPCRTADQKRADALVDLILNRPTAEGEATSGGRTAAVVQVTVPLNVLLGVEGGVADLKGYGPITAGQAREIAFAEGTVWRRLITAPDTGLLIKTDPTTYKPTAETARHVIARDAHCTFPHCNQPAHRCDLDHRDPFNHHVPEAGGQTTPDNLHPLCRRHHLLKTHHPGWTVTRAPDTGVTHWTSPTGHRYEAPPHTYLE
ncbi:HNH endonuclease signature motif containing protein [Streptomyces sannanensis]|uniref:HNH endonuclease signature motif containing protein n=1 Tax=Streptomyces sannanensis TaxID=285536 RepID=A0ABP6SA50_9ACTN